MIQCLCNLDVVAICCEIAGGEMVAQWVQINPKAIATILGTEQELLQPKTKDGMVLTVRVPTDLSPVYTDVRFAIVRQADTAVDSHPRADTLN